MLGIGTVGNCDGTGTVGNCVGEVIVRVGTLDGWNTGNGDGFEAVGYIVGAFTEGNKVGLDGRLDGTASVGYNEGFPSVGYIVGDLFGLAVG